MHLTAVHHYGNEGATEQVIQHMGSFEDLIDHQQDEELISEESYNILCTQAEDLLEIWK